MNLVEAVDKERQRRGLDHRGLSRLLGIHESLWHRVRTGEQPPTKKFLMGVMRNLPELALVVIDYMRNNGSKGGDHASE